MRPLAGSLRWSQHLPQLSFHYTGRLSFKLKLISVYMFPGHHLQSLLFNVHRSSNLLSVWVFEHGVRMDLRVVFTFCSAAYFLWLLLT